MKEGMIKSCKMGPFRNCCTHYMRQLYLRPDGETQDKRNGMSLIPLTPAISLEGKSKAKGAGEMRSGTR